MILMDIKGTSNSYLRIQKTGPRIKNVLGTFEVRNANDSAYVNFVAAILKAAADSIEINSDASGAGADWKYTLARPVAGMTSNLTITLPPDAGLAGYVLTTDGSGNLTWVAVLPPSGVMKTQSFTIPYNSFLGGTLNWFMLPANQCIDSVKFIVDTDFLGMPFDSGCFASVGNTVDLVKYYPTTFINTIPAGDASDKTKNQVPLGVPEQVTISAGGLMFESQGSLRIVAEYY